MEKGATCVLRRSKSFKRSWQRSKLGFRLCGFGFRGGNGKHMEDEVKPGDYTYICIWFDLGLGLSCCWEVGTEANKSGGCDFFGVYA